MDNEVIFFTAINPNNVEEETKINIYCNREDNTFAINNVPMDAQQLGELAMLLFSLANEKAPIDLDCCNELVESFDIPFPTNALQELINIEKES